MDVIVENLTKSFENQKAVDSISFQAKRGEILGFLGPNGAGKTTTMKIMAGLLTPDFGNITFGDYSIGKQTGKIKNIIGYLPERNPLYNEMNVIDFLFFISKLHNIPKYKITSRVLDMIRLCGLDNDKHKQIGELSKGFRQRVGIAQALIHDPEVVILDEPTTGLDPNQIFGIRKIIKEIGEEKTVILSSHILSEIETTCDQVMIMSNGKIVANGTTSELRRKSDAEYCLKVGIKGGETSDIHKALDNLPGVLHIEIIHKQNFELQCKPDIEIEKSIFSLCQDNNWYISELTPVQTRLEDIFRKVTQNG
ncbi:ATP-binding cassette domain-containing protein [Butyricimonas faecalis]|jgi:gliding motility protein|uniref:ATP-binding cassette domain-containing protein n=1 Tax=Butyricimonas faecalis TaxID=2093856 RepID=A0A3S9VXR1_9BACT|nr:ATP-binding cassette domain-containing protein [Butyricimonas faecalis]AZS31319.1 ATP-binding cassette domain-containing protein [Butyricimonas faecalis]